MARLLFSDAHLHLNPVGGVGARGIVDRLVKEGFWFVGLVSLPPYHYGFNTPTLSSFEKALDILVSQARLLRERGIKVKLLAGFHPAEVDAYNKQGLGLEEVYTLAERVLKLIESKIKEGVIDGIGEVGRQHYGTSFGRISVSEAVMIRALELARDLGAVVHLHLDQSGWATCHLVDMLTGLVKIDRSKVLVHHANTATAQACVQRGLPVSVPVKHDLDRTIGFDGEVLVESDFIDDNQRPGVSAYPWEIARVVNSLIASGRISEEMAYRVMVDNVVKFYGVEPP